MSLEGFLDLLRSERIALEKITRFANGGGKLPKVRPDQRLGVRHVGRKVPCQWQACRLAHAMGVVIGFLSFSRDVVRKRSPCSGISRW